VVASGGKPPSLLSLSLLLHRAPRSSLLLAQVESLLIVRIQRCTCTFLRSLLITNAAIEVRRNGPWQKKAEIKAARGTKRERENAANRARHEFRCARHYADSAQRFVIAVVGFALSMILSYASIAFSRVSIVTAKKCSAKGSYCICRNKKIYSRFCLTGR